MQRTSPLRVQNNVGGPMSQTAVSAVVQIQGMVYPRSGADAIGVQDSKFEGLSVASIQDGE